MPDPAPVEQQLSAAPEPALTPVIRLELAALIEELIQTIDLQVPAVGVLLRAPHVPDEIMDILQDFYLWFGSERREIPDWKINDYGSFLNQAFLLGCTIEELHTAYRVGALVVWRHLSAYGPGMGVPPARMYQLAEHLFAHLERFSADSADAFGLLRTDVTYALKERRKRLIRRLVSDTPFGSPSILEAAREAQWRLPEKVVCVAVPGDAAAELRLGAALDTDVLTDLERSDPFLLMPATELPVRRQMLRRALEGRLHALGPALALKDVGMSLRMAKTALALAEDGVLADEGGQISCEDHLTTLLMAEDDGVMELIMRRTLNELTDLSEEKQSRLCETLLLWLSTGSSLVEVAARLKVHPQTVRYRMRRIQEIFGDRLHDLDWRFETELALRYWQLQNRRLHADVH